MAGAPNAKRILNEDTKDGLSSSWRWIRLFERFIEEPEFTKQGESRKAEMLQPFMSADRALQPHLRKFVERYRAGLEEMTAKMAGE